MCRYLSVVLWRDLVDVLVLAGAPAWRTLVVDDVFATAAGFFELPLATVAGRSSRRCSSCESVAPSRKPAATRDKASLDPLLAATSSALTRSGTSSDRFGAAALARAAMLVLSAPSPSN